MKERSRTRIAEFIDHRIEELRGVKNQKEIAKMIGYNSPNIITMIKQGDTKVSLDRVGRFAIALDVDPAFLFRLAMEQFYNADTVKEIVSSLGEATSVNERKMLHIIREVSGNEDPGLTSETEKGLRAVFAHQA
jgi:transcriptional regulator with XRE-family HTH domain